MKTDPSTLELILALLMAFAAIVMGLLFICAPIAILWYGIYKVAELFAK